MNITSPDPPDLPDPPDPANPVSDFRRTQVFQRYEVVEQTSQPVQRRRHTPLARTNAPTSETFSSTALRLSPFFLMDALPIVQLVRDM